MKKFLLALLLILLPVLCFAQDEAQPVKPFAFDFGIEGDMVYLANAGMAGGVGVRIATIYDFVELRGIGIMPVNDQTRNLLGLGVGVDILKLVEKVGHVQWNLPLIQPSVGLLGAMDFNRADKGVAFDYGLYVSIMKIKTDFLK